MKNKIKNLIPEKMKVTIKQIIALWQLRKTFKHDMNKYKKYSFELSQIKTKRHYEADLIFHYHKIEKGLSLPKPRIGFGKNKVYYLLSVLEYYTNKFGWDTISTVSLNTLYEYYHFNELNGLVLDDLHKRIEKLKKTKKINNLNIGGITKITKEEINKKSINFKDFAFSRYSIRNFAPGDIDINSIKEAVEIAQKTPSVCNRQSTKVYVYSDFNYKKEILRYQNGNAGFGEDASKIIIVTSDLKDFRGVKERNQCYIDGGLYSMSLIYALHSLGLGTCALNLAIDIKTEKELKSVAQIDDSEELIMMIAVGNIPDKLSVATSHRRLADEVLTIL